MKPVSMHKLLLAFLLFAAFSSFGQPQVIIRLNLKGIPADTKSLDSFYIAGDFNGWNPRSEAGKFNSVASANGAFATITAPGGMASFKITRGSWGTVETDASGKDIENRVVKASHDTTVEIQVLGWKDRFAPVPKKHTANAQVHIISDSFAMPQLQRSRRVWIYLPKEYANNKRHYPVLYMHDGQNLFDESTAGFGEWGIDEAMDSLEQKHGGVIIVGIDHGGDKRLNEYCPYDMERYGKGEGKAYTDFLVQKLKPYIDKHFRTRAGRADTWIAGSSMGGLISLYAHLRYPQVFGGSGIFSPAFWIAPDLKTDVLRNGKSLGGKVFFYAGEQEGETMVPEMLRIHQLLHQLSKADMQTVIRSEGRHNEARWRQEFPAFIVWMLKKPPVSKSPKF
jgi:predicted alpha/beta superfamily hydrolase